jgi:hypothetical protein
VHARAEAPRVRLAARKEESERVRFSDMRPFDAEEFLQYAQWLRKKKSAKRVCASPMRQWSGVWYATRIEEACEQLVALGLSISRGLGSKPSLLAELVHRQGKSAARVKRVDAQFETLAAVAARLASWPDSRTSLTAASRPRRCLTASAAPRWRSGGSAWIGPRSSRGRATRATSAGFETAWRCTTRSP